MPSRSTRGASLSVFLEKSFWMEMWRSLKRVHKDRRARKQVFGLLLLLLIPLVLIGYLALLIGTGAWLIAPFVIPVMWWRARRARQDSEPIHIAPKPQAVPAMGEEGAKEIRRHFAELGLIYAVLLDRAGSERFLKEKELAPGMEVTSRRIHIALLRRYAVWERMAAPDRDLVMIPDGHWPEEAIHRMLTGLEPLRLLRWVLRIDFRLPHVGQQLFGDLLTAHELVMQPEVLFNGDALAELDVVRIARDDASVFRARCLAEAISRGYTSPQDEQTTRWAEDVAEKLRGKQSEDLVLGEKLVSESDRAQLEWAGLLAFMRCEFLNEVIAILESGKVPCEPLATVFARDPELAAARDSSASAD